MENLMNYILYFYIGSLVGWGMETAFAFCVHRRYVVRRSLLRLPLCPVYGISAVCLRLTLRRAAAMPLAVFWGGVVVVSCVEYMTEFFAEQFLGVRLWDYRQLRGNLHGRICPQFSLCWGLISVIFICVLEPYITAGLTALSAYSRLLLCTGISAVFLPDFSRTLCACRSFGSGAGQELKRILPYVERIV